MDGTTIVAGAPAKTIGSSTDQGSARVFFDPAPVADTTPPETSAIKGRKKVKRGKKPRYRFSSNEAGLDVRVPGRQEAVQALLLSLPAQDEEAQAGSAKLKVRAVDAAGNVDPTPARRKVKVRPAK